LPRRRSSESLPMPPSSDHRFAEPAYGVVAVAPVSVSSPAVPTSVRSGLDLATLIDDHKIRSGEVGHERAIWFESGVQNNDIMAAERQIHGIVVLDSRASTSAGDAKSRLRRGERCRGPRPTPA